MYYWEEEAEDESVEGYQKAVRARAGESLEELKQSLSSPVKSPAMSPEMKSRLSDAVHPRHLAYSGMSGVYSEAALQLRQQLDQGIPHMTSDEPTVRQYKEVPTIEATAAILQTQAGYVQQLEAENIFMKEELMRIRLKMNDLIEENRRLHEELKSSVLKEIIQDGGSSITYVGNHLTSEVFEAAAERGNLQKWQKDLARLNSLHEAKAKRLEAQLASAKSDVERYEQTVEDLKSQLRMRDTDIQVATREDGTSGTFIYSETQTTIHLRIIDRLTKERDDQLDLVAHFKHKIKDLEQREEEAYLQIKKGIELVEEAQLEQTEAIIEKEQLADELVKMRERFNQLLTDNQSRIEEERKTVRKENNLIVVELNTKIKELTEGFVTCQNQVDRLTREKTALSNELDDTKSQLKKYDKEVAMTTDSYRSESMNANIQRQQALHEVTRLRTDLQQCEKERDQDRSKYRAELEDLRRRLQKAEKELMNAKEECIHHTSNTQALERELHLAKMSRDSVERGRSEDLKALTRRTQQREQELNNYIHDIETKQAGAEREMDGMLKDQNNLIGRLRTECRHQANQLAKIIKKNRAEGGNLKNENTTLSMRLEKAVNRVKSLEEQTDQHSRLHEKMRQRLKMMDDHAQHQSQQVLDLLSRQSSLMKDRQLLARELEFLRSKLLPGNESDVEKLFTSRIGAVDEVLRAVTEETKGDNDVWTELLQPSLDNLDAKEELIGSS